MNYKVILQPASPLGAEHSVLFDSLTEAKEFANEMGNCSVWQWLEDANGLVEGYWREVKGEKK